MTKFNIADLFPLKIPVNNLTTKFGGQPVWYLSPQWPLSKTRRSQMMFVGQILLDPVIFGDMAAKVAYIFMTDDESDELDTMNPEGGENAVILQPGTTNIPVISKSTGPTIVTRNPNPLRSVTKAIEYSVRLSLQEENGDAIYVGTKIGGIPAWIYGPILPSGESWRLLLQLDPGSSIDLGLGDSGVLFALVNNDGSKGILLWQTH